MTREQTTKPQTYYRCCSQLSFLTPYWLFPRNIMAFLKYFWCSQFCEFHIKILFDKNHSFKCRGKASQVCAASSLSDLNEIHDL